MSDELLTSVENAILTITLNRPLKKNAITYDMYRSLTQLLQNAEDDPGIHVVVITGAGDMFTAGNDIKSFKAGGDIPYNERPSFHFMNTVATFKKPLIGALNGDAIGIGATMLFHCDLLYSVAGAKIRMPFISLKVVPEFASSLLLAKLTGHTRAFEIFTLDQEISCEEAEAVNWVNAVLPTEELMPFVSNRARQLAAKSPGAVQATKRLMKQPSINAIVELIDTESCAFVERLKTQEVQAVMSAFFQRS